MTAKYNQTFDPAVLTVDLPALAAADPGLVDAALAAVDDLAARRQIGKELGARNISGDLTGLRRLRFDLPGVRTKRYRVVYKLEAHTIEVLAIGERRDHVIYRAAVGRLPAD
ncbi:MAG TPA: type II toxin-antitoxin system RelE/ParE family toxin [Acidothermaceae bacterium]